MTGSAEAILHDGTSVPSPAAAKDLPRLVFALLMSVGTRLQNAQ